MKKNTEKEITNVDLLRMAITDRQRAEFFIQNWVKMKKQPRTVAVKVLESLGIDLNKLSR